MSRKNLVYNFKPIGSAAVPGDMTQAEIIGTKSNVANFDGVTYKIGWTGGQVLNGNCQIEYSTDINGEDSTFKILPLDGVPELSGAAGDHLVLITEIGFVWLRPRYIRTDPGATGTLEVSIFQTNKGA
jgi:hypothetical protein